MNTVKICMFAVVGIYLLTPTTVLADESPELSALKLSIVLSTSRPQVTAGAGFGVQAQVKNISTKDTIFIIPEYFTMTPPPEIDTNAPSTWWAVIQGNQPAVPANADQTKKDDWYKQPIRLGPQSTTNAFWAPSTAATSTSDEGSDCKSTWWRNGLCSLMDYTAEFIHVAAF